MKRFIFLLIISFAAQSFSQDVHQIIVDGVINPVSSEYIEKSIQRAENDNAQLLVIKMDTPGGLMESMHQIIKNIQSSRVPVAVYVAPPGSRAGSAGVYITYAAHIAAMAPSTNIGSAHPVFGMGMPGTTPDSSQSEHMLEKVTNDAAAKIRSLAEQRGRNAEWAEKAVRESVNITEAEALKMHVIDYVVPSLDSLLNVVDGKKIKMDDGSIRTLHTKNAHVVTFEMNWRQRFLDTIIDPNIAFILMMIGFFGIMFELYNPGTILPGVAGGICLILSFYAMQSLPVNYAAVGLIIFAIILFVLEIKVPSFGLLTIGGIISLVLGAIMLIDSPVPEFQIAWQTIVGVVIVTVLFFIFALGLALKSQRSKPLTGREGMVGESGVVYNDLEPNGTVQIHGEFWHATSEKPIKKGTRVKVLSINKENMLLKVEEVKE